MKVIFEVKAAFEKKIRLTEERLNYILFKHPEISNKTDKIRCTLIRPDLIRKSQYNPDVWLYYKFYKRLKKYLTVAVKLFNREGFVITSYITDRIKVGEEIWKEK
jgi:hypothetical protein